MEKLYSNSSSRDDYFGKVLRKYADNVDINIASAFFSNSSFIIEAIEEYENNVGFIISPPAEGFR